MKESKRDLITGAVLLFCTAVYFWKSFEIRVFSGDGATIISARTVPQIWAVFMAVLSLILIVRSVLRYKKENVQADKKTEKSNNFFKEYSTVICTFVLIIIYALLIENIGYLICTTLYIIIQIPLLTEKTRRTKKTIILSVIVAILFSVITNYLFVNIFNVPLPEGLLGF